MNIGGVEIGHGQPCRFVAEISNNHNGDYFRALRLIAEAKDSGADFVKFQCYTPSELVQLRGDGPAPKPWGAQGWTMGALYEKAQTPLVWFPELFQHARDLGIVPFSSVFGLESLLVLEKCACPAYKIAALDAHDASLVQAARSRGKPVIVSERGQYRADWDGDVSLFCPAGYPATNVRLPERMGEGDQYHLLHLGLSSHCLDPLLPIAAVARGAKLIEMHFMLDDEPSELEASVSLTASAFKKMVEDVRRVEAMLA